ncbi:outer membrane protein assembly factor BamE [Granulosicoccus sp. 3-233]|uniref:outer membrane protein assembly factor BamE n=1 Tax=Granulosicoccus sp. 3-233 TaxID=3417969 RepID=UPI003D33B4C6
MRSAACLAVMMFLLSACGGDPFWLPRAHKISIQQGNLLNEQQLAQITPGMNRQEVSNLIGSPVEKSPFRGDQWNYVYTRAPAGSAVKARRASIIFENDVVIRIDTTDMKVSGELPERRYFWEKKVDKTSEDVPYQEID